MDKIKSAEQILLEAGLIEQTSVLPYRGTEIPIYTTIGGLSIHAVKEAMETFHEQFNECIEEEDIADAAIENAGEVMNTVTSLSDNDYMFNSNKQSFINAVNWLKKKIFKEKAKETT